MKKTILLLVFAVLSCTVFSQSSRTISGKVVDDSTGDGLSGATVSIAGGRTVISDAAGNFTLTAAAGASQVVVRYTGYLELSMGISADGKLLVRLTRVAGTLDDIVVVGYQTVRKKDLTAAVSTVSSRDIHDIPINSAAEALAGRLAGVQITATEGSPNAEVLIRVRGGNSITQDNTPLYIIDGVQVVNGLNAISPQDIETVTVLKDAASTSIYGARGSNGVVIITTKGGKAQKPTISYNGFVGVNKIAKELDVMNPYDFVVYQYERSRGNATDSASFASQYGTTWDTLKNYRNTPFVNWQDQTFGQAALTQTNNVTLTGGDQRTQYSLSLTNNYEDGLQVGSGFNRKLASLRLDHRFSDRVKIGFSTRYNTTGVFGAGTSSTGSASTNNLRNSVKYRPLLVNGQAVDYYDPDYANQTNSNSLALVNPVLLSNAQYRRDNYNITNLSGYIDLQLAKFLTFKTTAGVDYTNDRQLSFDDTITGVSKLNGANLPLASIGTSRRTTISNSNVLTFSNASLGGSFNQKNQISLLIGHEIYINTISAENQLARYFPLGIDPIKALGNMNLGTNYLDNTRPPSSQSEERIVSAFSNLSYNYDRRYYLTASFRADGSTKFAPGNKWSYFPSVSLAWRVINERFMERSKSWLSDLKLRASYGEAGNNRISDFLYLTQFSSATQYYLNDQAAVGFTPVSLANPNLVWERTISRNIGLDIAFFKNRLQLSIDGYRNTTNDLLVAVPVPTSAGYTTQIQNVGSTQNQGVELQLSATLVQRKNFTWIANFNLSANSNKVTSLGTYQTSYLQNSGWGLSSTPADYIVRVGDPVGSMWGFTTDGFYQLSDFNYDPSTKIYSLKTGVASNASVISSIPMPGSLKFRDLNGDGLINDLDKSVIGVAQPKVFGGLNQQFYYKNFDLSIYLNYQFGNKVYNANKLEFTNGYIPNSNLLTIANSRWRTIDAGGNVVEKLATVGGVQVVQGESPEVLGALNQNAQFWIPSTASNSFNLHSFAVEDGSFVRINNITLGYNLPVKLISRASLTRARIYATVNNVAVITGYSGYDPEVGTRRSSPVTPGVDYSAYPRARTYILGINLSL